MERWIRPAFAVIGMEGENPLPDGSSVAPKLWEEANRRFPEVAPLAMRKPDGTLCGIWGAMTDSGRTFMPWENGFTEGLYLAGVECREDARPPEGWTRWEVPGFEYIRVRNDAPEVFHRTLAVLAEQGMSLAGAVQDYTDPATGEGYMCFPVRRLP